jgi:hypothetical protein
MRLANDTLPVVRRLANTEITAGVPGLLHRDTISYMVTVGWPLCSTLATALSRRQSIIRPLRHRAMLRIPSTCSVHGQ